MATRTPQNNDTSFSSSVSFIHSVLTVVTRRKKERQKARNWLFSIQSNKLLEHGDEDENKVADISRTKLEPLCVLVLGPQALYYSLADHRRRVYSSIMHVSKESKHILKR